MKHYQKSKRIMRKIFTSLLSTPKGMAWLILNFLKSIRLNDIQPTREGLILSSAPLKNEIDCVISMLGTLNNSLPDRYMMLLIKMCYTKLFFTYKENGTIRGIAFYYFNFSDLFKGTIHLGFYGVSDEYRGKGMGKMILRNTIDHYNKTELKGISLKVSSSNCASLNAIKSAGFKQVYAFYNPQMKENRYYMEYVFSHAK